MRIKDKDCTSILSDLVDLKEEIGHLKLGMDVILKHLGISVVVTFGRTMVDASIPIPLIMTPFQDHLETNSHVLGFSSILCFTCSNVFNISRTIFLIFFSY